MKTDFPATKLSPPCEGELSPHLSEAAEGHAQEPVGTEAVGFETQSTRRFAADLDVKPQSVRKRYSQTGSYFGIKPIIKLPNGHLRWPCNPVKLLATGNGK